MADQKADRVKNVLSIITREVFLAARKLPFERVDINPKIYGEGACLHVRSMTGQDRSDFEKRWAKKNAASDQGAFRWDLLGKTVCDPDGELLFTDADRQAFMQQDAATVEDIFEASCVLNGLRKKDIEDLAGNSEAAQ